MSEWKKVKLGDCCEITSSKRIFLSDYVPVGIPFYRSKEIAEMQKGESISDPLFISNDKYEEIKCKFGIPHKGDLLLTAIGATLGIPFVIKNNQPFYFKDGNLIWFKNFNDLLDSSFLYTWMCSSYGYQSMQNIAIGSAQKALTISALKDLSLIVPPIDIQHRIATILSRYDSLIENYQKQIKLLEEVAQRLYKEWFVDLHFPGHENTKIVNGVPEGWEKAKLGDLVEFKRGKTITKKEVIEGPIPVVAGGINPAYYCNKSNTADRVITISASGYAGFVKLYYERIWASDCSFIDVSTTDFLHFVYCHLKTNQTSIYNMQRGSAQQHVYAKDINSLNLCIPIESVLKSFEEKASKYFDTISSLQYQIRLLTEARDRLLPKLMNGEIIT